ncbi:hypothetical protein BC831DRAFT_67048 [Entophlyctis helioformis]|nr:hypothetical protein BC831DRAFT_67048 [Entophlyctis helioformis]
MDCRDRDRPRRVCCICIRVCMCRLILSLISQMSCLRNNNACQSRGCCALCDQRYVGWIADDQPVPQTARLYVAMPTGVPAASHSPFEDHHRQPAWWLACQPCAAQGPSCPWYYWRLKRLADCLWLLLLLLAHHQQLFQVVCWQLARQSADSFATWGSWTMGREPPHYKAAHAAWSEKQTLIEQGQLDSGW